MLIGQCGILSMIHTPIYPDLKREKSINVASFLYRERVDNTNGVFIIDSIPHCPSGLQLHMYIHRTVWNTVDDTYSNFVFYIVTKQSSI